MLSEPAYLTIDGVAELLGRPRRAVERMVARGTVPYRKHGKRIIFIRAELLAFLEGLPGTTLAQALKRPNDVDEDA